MGPSLSSPFYSDDKPLPGATVGAWGGGGVASISDFAPLSSGEQPGEQEGQAGGLPLPCGSWQPASGGSSLGSVAGSAQGWANTNIYIQMQGCGSRPLPVSGPVALLCQGMDL